MSDGKDLYCSVIVTPNAPEDWDKAKWAAVLLEYCVEKELEAINGLARLVESRLESDDD